MAILAMSSTSVIDVLDGNSVVDSIVEYSVSSDGSTVPGTPLVDGSGNPIVDMNNVPLTSGSWNTTIPTIADGQWLWTRTRTIYSDGQFTIVYNVSRSGTDGATGAQGIGIATQKEQWYLSSSSTSLQGGSWSYTEPEEIPDGKYLWGRLESTMTDGSKMYSDAVYRKTIGGLIDLADEINKKITQKIWQSDVDAKISVYDSSTAQTIRDRVTQTESDISGITSTVSDVQSTLSTKADGSTVTALQNTVTQNKQTADAFQQTVTSTYAKLTDVAEQIDSIKIGGNNLYVIADEVPGYLHSNNTGAIATQQVNNKEITSDYIPVKAGSNYIIQSWCTPSAAGESWLAYQFFSDNDPVTPVGNRTSKYGKDSGSKVETTAEGQEHLVYDVQAPEGATLLRVSYRSFNDGYAMVECATKPSEYSINSRDIEQYTDDAVESAKSEIKQTTDSISLEVSKKVGSSEIISKINQSPESVTISASKIDLIGNVTFNMFDSDTQNALTSGSELIIGSQTAQTSAWTGTSTKLSTIGSGTRISYKLPYASTNTAVTLNLTLNNNTTTGAKEVYYLNNTRLNTQYGVNSIVELIYDGSAWRVINPYSDANTYDRTRYQQAIKAGATAITAGNIIVAGANNVGTYTHLKLGNAFDTTYPILYAGSNIAANSTGNNNYLIIPLGITTTQTGTYTAYKSVYIKGTLSGTTFTPVSTTPLTQTIPTSADNYHYMLLGTMYSTTEMYLLGDHPIFQYYKNAFMTTTQIAAEAATTAETANSTANTANTNASNAVSTANTANTNASNAVAAVNASIKSTTMHYLATTAASGVTRSTSGWTTTVQSITSSKRYLWTYQTITKVDNTTTDTDPVISGVWGNSGTSVTVSSNVTTYQVGTSGTTAPTGTWQDSVPSVADGQFLWTRVVTTFSDSSTATSYSVAKQGIQGTSVTVSSTSTTYQSGTSGTTAPTGTWQTTIPTVTQGNYLWTKTVVTYSDGKSTTSYAVSYQSEDGDNGVGVTKVEQLYRTSNSTTAPAAPTSTVTSTSTTYNTWTLAMPTYNSSYPYYYTCTQTTYTNGSHTWTTVARSMALEDANTTANTANTNASNAVSTANTANTNASNAVSTANTANTNASNAVSTANTAKSTADTAKSTADTATDMASKTLGMKVNYSAFNTVDNGEVYLHGYTNNAPADVNGYVYWNGVKRNVPKGMINPNAILPYYKTILIVLRLSSAAATSGTLYLVWYNGGWKHSVTQPSAVAGDWSWAENTDIVLGQFIEPSNEAAIVDAYLYEPPRNASHVLTTGVNSYGYSQNAVTWVSNNGTNMTNALSMIKKWTNNAVSDTTTIQGGWIATNTITSQQLATNAIVSNNYIASTNLASPYSATGTFLDLSNGNFWTPNFGVINTTPDGSSVPVGAWFNGTVYASAGKFGTDTSYWNIETVYDYNNQAHASLVGVGDPYLQTGNWQVSDNAVATRKYTSTNETSGTATYYKDTNSNTFYDVGMKIPTNFGAYSNSDSSVVKYNKAFFYGRKYTGNNVPALDADWTYFFMIDASGNIFENGTKLSDKYASIDGVSGAYLPLTGGTISGNLTVSGTLTATASAASKLASSKNLNVSLSKTTNSGIVAFDGSSAVTIGVTGTLGVGNGGTGATTFTSGEALIGNGTGAIQTRGIRNNTTIGNLGWTASGTDNTLATTNTIAYWNGRYNSSASNLEYVKLGKLGTVVTHNIEEFITTAGGTVDELTATDLSAGNLTVTGGATFTNGLTGDLIGDVTGNVVGNVSGTSSGVTDSNNGTKTTFAYSKSGLAANWATNPWFAAWNGYELRAISPANLKTTIGLGNVDNTADANKAVLTATKFASAQSVTLTGDTTGTASSQAGWSIATVTKLFTGTIETDAALTTHPGDGKIRFSYNVSNPTGIFNRKDNSNAIITINRHAGNYDSQIGFSSDGNIYYRKFTAVALDNTTAWKTMLDSSNYTSYTVTKTGTGASGTWGISITGNAATATSATSATTATYSSYPKIVSSNEIRFDVSTKPSSAVSLHFGYKWSDGTSDAKINRYIFDNGGAALAEVQASTFYGALSGNASTATTAGSLTTGRDFTIGKTTKSAVKWDGAVAFTQAEISDCASNTADGWMSKDDKAKLDQITVSDIGRVSADTIVGETNGGITVTVTSGVAKLKHTNQLSAAGTAQGTANGTTLTNGGTFTIPKITYDINGHITGATTNTLTLPSITSVTGNAGTATKFASNQSVTLTGDTTGTASSQAGWSVATKTIKISGINKDGAAQSGTTSRPTTANINYADDGFRYFIASASMTTGKPANDAKILHMAWDNGAWDSQLAVVHNSDKPYIQIRSEYGTANTWGDWITVLDSNNYNNYSPKLDGTGASGTWGISISGNAATATTATSATTATTATTANNLAGFKNTTTSGTAIDSATTNGIYYVTGTSGIYNQSDGVAFVQGYNVSWVTQIYQDYRTGQIAVRGKNNGTWQAWRKVLDSTNYSSYALPLSGGTMTGPIKWNSTSLVESNGFTYLVGIDAFASGGQMKWSNASNVTVGAATKATQDGNGATISTTYAKLSGATFTGAVSGTTFTGTSFAASSYLSVNSGNSGTAGGLALWSTDPTAYGIMLRTTANQGNHGYVQGEYAAYLTMSGATASAAETRGWVFKNKVANACVASISALGHAVFNGSVTVGGNTTNTSGMRMEYDATLSCTNFVFY